MNRRTFLAATAGAGLTTLAGCGGDGDGDDGGGGTDVPEETIGTTVTITEDAVEPLKAEVEAGMAVEWVNESGSNRQLEANTAIDGAESWDFSRELQDGESVAFVFEDDGVYSYHDAIKTRFRMCGAVAVGSSTAEDVGTLPCESG